MKKLTALFIVVALLSLPTIGQAEGKTNPPKPGTQTNPGLSWAATQGWIMSLGANFVGFCTAWWLWLNFPPFPEDWH